MRSIISVCFGYDNGPCGWDGERRCPLIDYHIRPNPVASWYCTGEERDAWLENSGLASLTGNRCGAASHSRLALLSRTFSSAPLLWYKSEFSVLADTLEQAFLAQSSQLIRTICGPLYH